MREQCLRGGWLIFIDVISVVFGAGADPRARHRLGDHAGSMQMLVYGRRLVASQRRDTDKLPGPSVAQNSLSLTQSNLTHIRAPPYGGGSWTFPGPAS